MNTTTATPGNFVYTTHMQNYDYMYYSEHLYAISFNTSRYGKHRETLYFQDQVTRSRAIKEAEHYLSEPLTKEYFDNVKDDLEIKNLTWEEAQEMFNCRGDVLGDSKIIEVLEYIYKEHLSVGTN